MDGYWLLPSVRLMNKIESIQSKSTIALARVIDVRLMNKIESIQSKSTIALVDFYSSCCLLCTGSLLCASIHAVSILQ